MPAIRFATSAEGAQRVYIEGIRPWLLKYQTALDHGLAALLHALVRARCLLWAGKQLGQDCLGGSVWRGAIASAAAATALWFLG